MASYEKARVKYSKFTTDEWTAKKYLDRANDLHNELLKTDMNPELEGKLQTLDKDISETMLEGEKQCSTQKLTRDPWSPTLLHTGRTFTYWKRKSYMVK